MHAGLLFLPVLSSGSERHFGVFEIGRTNVRGDDDNGIFEIHAVAPRIGQTAIVEDL